MVQCYSIHMSKLPQQFTKSFGFAKTKWFIACLSVLVGALIIMTVRFATYKTDHVHYHANFAVYINGQREQFKDAHYYTEVEMCTLDEAMLPKRRAHMHDDVNNVVHVEDHAVTWGQFFDNIGWTLGSRTIISSDNKVYTENETQKLHLMINGQDYTDVAGLQNTVIKDNDKLLVSYGEISEQDLKQQYNSIPSTASEFDKKKDPANCSGSHETNFHDRITHLF